jgi:hypothetical protein
MKVIKEQIICAANWYKDLPLKQDFEHNFRPVNCDRGVVFCAHRHAQAMYTMIAVYGLRQCEAGEEIQGFLTNKNRFVDRKEGADIWLSNGGTLSYGHRLFSEDLY